MLIRKSLPLLPLNGWELLCSVRESAADELSLAESYLMASQHALWTQASRVAHTTKFELTLPCFPFDGFTKNLSVPFTDTVFVGTTDVGIELRAVPFLRLESVTYLDTDGAAQTLDSANYYVLDGGSDAPATLYMKEGYSWPDTYDQLNAVTITFYAGEVTEVDIDVDNDTLTTVDGFTYEDGDAITVSLSGNSNSLLGDTVTSVGTTRNKTYYVVNSSGSEFQIAETVDGAAIDLALLGSVCGVPDSSVEQLAPYASLYVGTLSPLVRRTLVSTATDWWLNRCPTEDCNCMTGEAAKLSMRFDLLRWNFGYGD